MISRLPYWAQRALTSVLLWAAIVTWVITPEHESLKGEARKDSE